MSEMTGGKVERSLDGLRVFGFDSRESCGNLMCHHFAKNLVAFLPWVKAVC